MLVLYKSHRRVARCQCEFNNLICIRKPACDTSQLHLIQTELNSTSLIKLSAIDWLYTAEPVLVDAIRAADFALQPKHLHTSRNKSYLKSQTDISRHDSKTNIESQLNVMRKKQGLII